MDLYILNEIQKLKGGGSSSSSSSGGSTELFPQEEVSPINGAQTVVSFSGIHERYFHQSYDYTTNHPYAGQNLYAYDGGDWQTREAWWRVPLGTGFYRFNNTQAVTGNNTKAIRTHYRIKDTLGSMHMQTMEGRASDNYAPHAVNIMFVRNPTSSDITRTLSFAYSNRWNNGYEGAALHVYTPNAVNYTDVTSNTGSWSTPWNTSSGGSYHTQDSASVTIPAGKTVAIMLVSTLSYWTNSSYWTHFRNTNYFRDLKNFFTGDLVCDLKLSQTYKQAHTPALSTVSQSNYQGDTFYLHYNRCGEIFGNRA